MMIRSADVFSEVFLISAHKSSNSIYGGINLNTFTKQVLCAKSLQSCLF